jgi:hypothetical protein
MKRHSKGHVCSLYCNYKAKSGNAWKMMQLLWHSCLKKLTLVIRFIDISLLHTELGLTSWLLTNCLVNMLLSPI